MPPSVLVKLLRVDSARNSGPLGSLYCTDCSINVMMRPNSDLGIGEEVLLGLKAKLFPFFHRRRETLLIHGLRVILRRWWRWGVAGLNSRRRHVNGCMYERSSLRSQSICGMGMCVLNANYSIDCVYLYYKLLAKNYG